MSATTAASASKITRYSRVHLTTVPMQQQRAAGSQGYMRSLGTLLRYLNEDNWRAVEASCDSSHLTVVVLCFHCLLHCLLAYTVLIKLGSWFCTQLEQATKEACQTSAIIILLSASPVSVGGPEICKGLQRMM